MKTINFGKYLHLFQIEPIKTVEFKIMQVGKKKKMTCFMYDKNASTLKNGPINCGKEYQTHSK
jgi:hypothetical protein